MRCMPNVTKKAPRITATTKTATIFGFLRFTTRFCHALNGLDFLSAGTIAIITTNCRIMNMPKAPTEPVTGKTATLTMLKTKWKTTGRRRLPFVWLKTHVMKNVVGTMNRKFIMK